MEKKILDLPLKAKWYDMIESGEKTEEYREIKRYWGIRLTEIQVVGKTKNGDLIQRRPKHFDYVRFRYGYTKRTMLFEWKGMEQGVGNSEWGAPKEEVYIIKLGKRIK